MFDVHSYIAPALSLSRSQLEALEEIKASLNNGALKLACVVCPCGRKDDYQIASHDRYGIPIKTVICRNCGLGRTSENFDDHSTEIFYRHYYRKLYLGESEATDLFFADQISRGNAFADRISQLRPLKGLRVCDVGCGAGGMSVPFITRGASYVGCDLGDRYLKYGKALGLSLYKGSISAINCPKTFDLILLSHVLEHVLNPKSMIMALAHRLSHGGLLAIEVPGLLSIDTFYQRYELAFHLAHPFHYCSVTLRELARQCGLETIHVDETSFAVLRKSSGLNGECDQSVTMGLGDQVVAKFASTKRRIRIKRAKQSRLGRMARVIVRGH